MQDKKGWFLLDRDGVINEESAEYIKSPDEWHPIPGSLEAIARLNRVGYGVAVISNQAGVGRGLLSLEMLEQIHERMRQALAAVGGHIDALYFCHHHPDDHCACRKPKPGLLLQFAHEHDVDLHEAVFIGDTARDIEVARAVGCCPVLVRTGYGRETLSTDADLSGVEVFNNLLAVVERKISE